MTDEQLILAYLNGSTIQEIADLYTSTRGAVWARIQKLRKAGVELPRRRDAKITEGEVERLNQIVKAWQETPGVDDVPDEYPVVEDHSGEEIGSDWKFRKKEKS